MKRFLFLKALIFMFYSSYAFSIQVSGPLTSVDWLDKNIKDVVIIDVRKDKKSFTAKAKKGNRIAGMQGCGAKKGSSIKYVIQ